MVQKAPDEFDPLARPPDEAEWERRLFRNEKLIDKYMDVLGDNPDWEKWRNPRDLFNKVHYGIEPGEPVPPRVDEHSDDDEWSEELLDNLEWSEEITPLMIPRPNAEQIDEGESGEKAAAASVDPDNEDVPSQEVVAFHELEEAAMDFGVRLMRLEDWPNEAERVAIAGCKIGAHVAGGHAFGYDEEGLCGNIVKCRWALAECLFVINSLEFLATRHLRPEYATLLADARTLQPLIEARIARLRARVWW